MCLNRQNVFKTSLHRSHHNFLVRAKSKCELERPAAFYDCKSVYIIQFQRLKEILFYDAILLATVRPDALDPALFEDLK